MCSVHPTKGFALQKFNSEADIAHFLWFKLGKISVTNITNEKYWTTKSVWLLIMTTFSQSNTTL